MNEEKIAQIRLFNRYYTSVLGLLDRHYLNSDFSLTETRIMFEIHQQAGGITASRLIELLHLDKGYLSRILQAFEKKKLIEKKTATNDKRSFYLHLSPSGLATFLKIDAAAQQLAVQMLSSLTESETVDLVGHMNAIRQILRKSNTLKE
jgi:DNA-binding MarR family transcriptional regulator